MQNIEENDGYFTEVVYIRNTHNPRYFKCWFFTSRDKKPFQISAPLFEEKMYLADCFGRPVIRTEMEFRRMYVREHIHPEIILEYHIIFFNKELI